MEETFLLKLDKYQRDNLVALLKVTLGGKVGPLDTGDWCAEIYYGLTEGKGFDPEIHSPNILPEHQIRYVEDSWKYRLKGPK